MPAFLDRGILVNALLTPPSLQTQIELSPTRDEALPQDEEVSILNFKVPELQVATAIDARQSCEPSCPRLGSPSSVRPLQTGPQKKMSSNESVKTGATQELSQWMVDASKSDLNSKESTDNYKGTTYTPGKAGHVDLEVDMQQASGLGTQAAELDATPQNDVRTEIFPEDKRFREPETPATTDKPRNGTKNTGAVITTPQLPSNPFARQGAPDTGGMGLSQVFKITQAPSSPTAVRLPPVPSSDRPSPGVEIANPGDLPFDIASDNISPILTSARRPMTAPSPSSPVRSDRKSLQRTITEPHTKYVPKKLSQEERERRAQSMTAPSRVNQDVDFADAAFNDMEDHNRYLKRRKTERDNKALFDSITAPSRRTESGTKRNVPTASKQPIIRSPIRGRDENHVIVLPDEASDNSTEDETEQEDDLLIVSDDSGDDITEDNKENMNHGQIQVPMTGLRIKRVGPSSPWKTKLSPSASRQIQVSRKDDSEDELANGHGSHGPQTSKLSAIVDQEAPAVTIADSQSSQKKAPKSVHAAQVTGLVSSTDPRNIIPQSQAIKVPASSVITSSLARRHIATSSQQNLSPPLTSSPPNQHEEPQPKHRVAKDVQRETSQEPTFSPKSSPPPMPPGFEPKRHSDHGSAGGEDGNIHNGLDDNDTSEENRNVHSGDAIKTTSDVMTGSSRPPRTEQTSSSQPVRLPSTIPETVSRQSINNELLQRKSSPRSPLVRRVAGPGSGKMNSTDIVANSDEFAIGSSDLHGLLQSPPRARSQQQTTIEPRTPKSGTPRKPRPFTSITAEAQVSQEAESGELDFGLLTGEDAGFREQMARLESSSPIGPVRKRRRGLSGRPTVTLEPSSANKPDSSAQPHSDQPRSTVEEPGTDQEDELATGVRTSPTAARRVSHRITRSSRKSQQTAAPGLDASEEPLPKSTALENSTRKPQRDLVESVISNLETTPKRVSKTYANKKRTVPRITSTHDKNERSSPPYLDKLSVQTISAPHRIFAHFNGNPEGYFAATCLAAASDGLDKKYKVRFDDGQITEVNKVKRLELREGDSVKIYRTGCRTSNYVVSGLQRAALPSEAVHDPQFPQTDTFGNRTIKVRRKAKRDDSEDGPEEVVSLTDIYLTGQMWSTFKDREYTHPFSHGSSGLQTPLEVSSSPSTPQSRMRSAKVASNLSTNQRAISASKAMVQPTSNLFADIVFAMTFIPNDAVRARAQRSITDNGGLLLSSGFEDLFHTPSPESLSSSNPEQANSTDPSSSSPSSPNNTTNASTTFSLTPLASEARFALLLADSHCRTTKYFQALALGVPCIHTRWVTDCVHANSLQDWRPYLLASGESAFLGRAVCSRVLNFDCRNSDGGSGGEVPLATMIAAREKWLEGSRVLLVGDGKASGKVVGAYVFIAYALGAGTVGVVGNRKEAEMLLRGKLGGAGSGGGGRGGGEGGGRARAEKKEWDWVCVVEDERDAAGAAGAAKKRKRGSSGAGRDTSTVVVGSPEMEALRKVTKAKVVGTETVVQSLISGRLWEE